VKVRLLRPTAASDANPPEISVHAVAGQDVNVIVELNNMSFTSYGTHKFDLEVDGSSIGAYRSRSCRCSSSNRAAARNDDGLVVKNDDSIGALRIYARRLVPLTWWVRERL